MAAPAFAKTKLLAHDVLGAIFAEAKKTYGVSDFPLDDDGIQDFFHDLTLTGDYPLLARFFVFSGPNPESKKLTEAMARLQLAGSIGRLNPAYEVTIVHDTGVRYYDEVIKDFLSEHDSNQVIELARLLAERCVGAGA